MLLQDDTNPFIPSTLITGWGHILRTQPQTLIPHPNDTIQYTFQSDHKDLITNIIMFLLSHICACFNGVRVYILKPRLPVFPWVWGQRGDFCILQGKSETQITPTSTTAAKGLPSVILNHISSPKNPLHRLHTVHMSFVAADVRNHVCKSRSIRHIWVCVCSHCTVINQTYDYGYSSWSLRSRKPNIFLFRLNTTFRFKVESKNELCKELKQGSQPEKVICLKER